MAKKTIILPVNPPTKRNDKPKKKAKSRKFEAAQFSKFNSTWLRSQYLNFDTEIAQDTVSLRARARDASINNPYIRRYFGSLKQNVVGTRPSLCSQSRDVQRFRQHNKS